MASVQLTSAPASADHPVSLPSPREMSPADVAAHQAASYVRPARNTGTDRAAVRFRICRDTIAELSAKDARAMTPADFDRLAQAQAELAEITATLVPVDSDPDADEALRRVRGGQARTRRTLASAGSW